MVIVVMWIRILPFLCVVLASGGAIAQEGSWGTFNGDLKAQKYSPLKQITPDNVGNLEVAWRTHTGDVSTGGAPPMGMHMRPDAQGKIPKELPPTVWSATPLF